MKPRVIALCLVLSAAAAMLPGRAAPGCDPNNPPSAAKTQDLPDFAGILGHYVEPVGEPTSLVAFFHGYRNRSNAWICHMLEAASHGALAFGLDYRGTGYTGAPADNRGWFVREGAEDSIRLANYFKAQHSSIETVISFGVSMGGNASGLAVAREGNPFDYWVNVEGATSPVETYLEAAAVAQSGNAYAVGAVEDIEMECGGMPHQAPDCYQDLSVLTHTAAIAEGLKGSFMAHGLEDGLVPHNQSQEMAAALRAAGVPVDYAVVGRRNDWQNPASAPDEAGTTLTSYAGAALNPAGFSYPLAGHGWEGSDTHIVIATGFQMLWDLLDDGTTPANREYVVDSEAGTTRVL